MIYFQELPCESASRVDTPSRLTLALLVPLAPACDRSADRSESGERRHHRRHRGRRRDRRRRRVRRPGACARGGARGARGPGDGVRRRKRGGRRPSAAPASPSIPRARCSCAAARRRSRSAASTTRSRRCAAPPVSSADSSPTRRSLGGDEQSPLGHPRAPRAERPLRRRDRRARHARQGGVGLRDVQDAGDEYVDLGARAANARRMEARLVEMLATRTGKLSDVAHGRAGAAAGPRGDRALRRAAQVAGASHGAQLDRHHAARAGLRARPARSEPDRRSRSPRRGAVRSGSLAWSIAALGVIVPVGLVVGGLVLAARKLPRLRGTG